MDIGLVGLGRMGGNMALRLVEAGHRVVAYDRDPAQGASLPEDVVRRVDSLEALAGALPRPRAVWIMVPAGRPVDDTIAALRPHLAPGDVVVDGGNSHFGDSVRRASTLADDGIGFVDVGTSGGIWGRTEGYCLMVGGDPEHVSRLEPVFRALATDGGYAHVGPVGAGHYAKMVHNAIEYGMLQAYAEGFELLHESPYRYDLARMADLWNHGSVIRSWLLELAHRTFRADPHLETLRGYVEDSGEGRWAVAEAIERDVPMPVITLSLLARLRSRQPDSFAAKVIAGLRREFGGHAVRSSER